jgi:hypothetical protein
MDGPAIANPSKSRRVSAVETVAGLLVDAARREAAGWLGMTLEQLENGYGHHRPDFREEAAEAFSGRRS